MARAQRVECCIYDVKYNPQLNKSGDDPQRPKINLSLNQLREIARDAGVAERDINMAFGKQELADMIRALNSSFDPTISSTESPDATKESPDAKDPRADNPSPKARRAAATSGTPENPKAKRRPSETERWQQRSEAGLANWRTNEEQRDKQDVDVESPKVAAGSKGAALKISTHESDGEHFSDSCSPMCSPNCNPRVWRQPSSEHSFRVRIVYEDGTTKKGKVTPDMDVFTVMRCVSLDPSQGLSLADGGETLEQTCTLSELGLQEGVQLFVVPSSAASQKAPAADYLQKLFENADTNSDGVLSPDEFSVLLGRSGFNFPDDVIAALTKAADVNGDGVLQYDEFVPTILGLLEVANEADLAPDESGSPDDMLSVPMWDEVPAEELDRYLVKLFPSAASGQAEINQEGGSTVPDAFTRTGSQIPAAAEQVCPHE